MSMDRDGKKQALTAMHDMGKAAGLRCGSELLRALALRGKRVSLADVQMAAAGLEIAAGKLQARARLTVDAVTMGKGMEVGHG